jgi:hypothetical protein
MEVTPRLVGLLSLTAIVPAVVFIVLNAEWLAAVTLVNVLIIAASVAIALSPHEHDHDGDAHANGA